MGERNIMRFNGMESQSMRRPQTDIYYTEISWQGITGPGQIASRAGFCCDKGIQPKDLRLLESNFSGTSLWLRGEAIIINTNGFRAVVTAESVAMLNDPHVTYNQYQHFPVKKSGNEGLAFSHRQEFTSNLLRGISNFSGEQRGTVKEEKSAYDFEYSFKLLALRSILEVMFLSLEKDLEVMKVSIELLLNTLEKEIRSKTVEKLLVSAHQLRDFTGKCVNLKNCLDKMSEQASQYFQSRENPAIRKAFAETEEEQALNVIHHTDLLTLIEQYSADEIIEEVGIMMRHLQMKEDTANLIINTNQLDLVYLGLKLEVLAVGVTLGALLTGTFGMNLKSGIEETDWAFAIASVIIFTLSGGVILVGLVYVRNIGRNL
ncbi:magnesium ion transporter [Puccinia graminis f. sp. tritici]|nr:magnesium ion transporter [Puccinia graminis f. sp. tritici]